MTNEALAKLKADAGKSNRGSKYYPPSTVLELIADMEALILALNEAETIANTASLILADAHDDDANCLFKGAYGPDAVGCLACLAQDELAKINADKLREDYKGCPLKK